MGRPFPIEPRSKNNPYTPPRNHGHSPAGASPAARFAGRRQMSKTQQGITRRHPQLQPRFCTTRAVPASSGPPGRYGWHGCDTMLSPTSPRQLQHGAALMAVGRKFLATRGVLCTWGCLTARPESARTTRCSPAICHADGGLRCTRAGLNLLSALPTRLPQLAPDPSPPGAGSRPAGRLEGESAPEDALAQCASLRTARWLRMWQWMSEMPSVATGWRFNRCQSPRGRPGAHRRSATRTAACALRQGRLEPPLGSSNPPPSARADSSPPGTGSRPAGGLEEESAPEDALAQCVSLRTARWLRMWQWMSEMPSVATGLRFNRCQSPRGRPSAHRRSATRTAACACASAGLNLLSALPTRLPQLAPDSSPPETGSRPAGGLEEESAPEDALAQRASLRTARWLRMWQWLCDMPSVATGLRFNRCQSPCGGPGAHQRSATRTAACALHPCRLEPPLGSSNPPPSAHAGCTPAWRGLRPAGRLEEDSAPEDASAQRAHPSAPLGGCVCGSG